MYIYLLIFTACLNVETEVQCTAVPSTLTLWRETKWSNPLLIRRIAMTCWCNRNLQRKNVQIILKCDSPTFTIGTEYLSFYTLINTKFQQLPPPPYQEGTHRNLTVIHTGRGGGGIWTLPGWGWELQLKVQVFPSEQTHGSERQIHIF